MSETLILILLAVLILVETTQFINNLFVQRFNIRSYERELSRLERKLIASEALNKVNMNKFEAGFIITPLGEIKKLPKGWEMLYMEAEGE